MQRALIFILLAILLLPFILRFNFAQRPPLLDNDEMRVELHGSELNVTDKLKGTMETIPLPEGHLQRIIRNKDIKEPPLMGQRINLGVLITGKEETYIVILDSRTLISYPTPTYGGDFLIIDKSRNLLYFYKNKELVKRYPVATGSEVEYTPEGIFKIIVKSDLIRNGPPGQLGTRWMGLEIPPSADKRGPQDDERSPRGLKYGIHGTDEPLSIGNPASGGCIRMHNQDVEELFAMVPLGTMVLIKP